MTPYPLLDELEDPGGDEDEVGDEDDVGEEDDVVEVDELPFDVLPFSTCGDEKVRKSFSPVLLTKAVKSTPSPYLSHYKKCVCVCVFPQFF